MRFVRLTGHTALFAASGWFWWDFAWHMVELVSTPAGALGIAAMIMIAGLPFLLAPNKWARKKLPIGPLTARPRLVWSQPRAGNEQGADGAS